MKNRIIITVIAAIYILSLSSCSRRLTDFTVISTKNIPISEGSAMGIQKGSTRVKGVDVSHTILFIPLGMPNLKDAIDRAIESTPGAIGLADGVVKTSGWWALLYGQDKYIVEGTPIFSADYNQNKANSNADNNSYQNPNSHSTPTYVNQNSSETMVFYHKVKEGETIVEIAKLYGVKIGDILKWNNLNNGSISAGQTLTILYSE